jgi:hypothetical protein
MAMTEPTEPVNYSRYESTQTGVPPIPPPPPPPVSRRKWWHIAVPALMIVALVALILVPNIALSKLPAHTLATHFDPGATAAAQAGATQEAAETATASVPTPAPTIAPTPTPTLVPPTPTPALYTGPRADDLLKAFINDPAISVACSADAGCIYPLSNSWWLNCCQYYPAHGSYQFYDYSGSGSGFGTEMIVAVFENGRNAQTDLNGLIGTQAWTAPQYTVVGNCALVTADIYQITDWSYYVATMQQYCH